jgi:hypothetical protein
MLDDIGVRARERVECTCTELLCASARACVLQKKKKKKK